MYTGANYLRDLRIRTNQGQAGQYLNTNRVNYCTKFAINSLLEKVYQNIISQKAVDNVSPLIKTYQSYIPVNNQVLLKPLLITNVTIGTNAVITFDRVDNLEANTPIVVSGVVGVTGINTTISTYTILSPTQITTTITTTGTYVAGTGQATCAGYIISDYYHLLFVSSIHRAILNVKINTVIDVVSGTTLKIGTNNIRQGEYLYFSDFTGLAGINGNSFYIKKINLNTIQLYQDAALRLPANITGSWTGQGYIWRTPSTAKVKGRGTKALISNAKWGYYGADEAFVLYEDNDNRLRVYTSERNTDTNIVQLEYLVDYITVQADIDITNTTYDLLQVYNMEMINMIIEMAADEFFAVVEDEEGVKLLPMVQG